MKLMFSLFVAVLFVTIASPCVAEEFSRQNVAGNWTWTHMILDGEQEYKIDNQVELQADGTYVQYDRAGGIRVRATWEISGNTLVYNDEKGEQQWELVAFEDGRLHFDHAGAEMFFVRR